MAASLHAFGSGSQNTTLASFSVTVAISGGDAVVIMASWTSTSTETPTVTTTGGAGSDTATVIFGPMTGTAPATGFRCAGFFIQNSTAARTGVTLTWASSIPNTSDAGVWSFTGLSNPILDRTASAVGTGAPSNSAFTLPLSSAGQFATGYIVTSTTTGGTVTGWIDDGLVPLTGSRAEHRFPASTTAIQSVFSTTGNWLTFCLTFMAAPTTVFSFNSVW